ncbi:MAG: hypothetical protein JJU36_18125 [Phycisphaeraceae bacterium]|nr:hypothetical protein [Phycisphaeraceae bacterium]
MSPPITAAILLVSDSVCRDNAEDTVGPGLTRFVEVRLAAMVVARMAVPRVPGRISQQIRNWAINGPHPDLILTCGGTGMAPNDVTPEATLAVLERRHPGLLELMRIRCFLRSPRIFLACCEAGMIHNSLVINLPGGFGPATISLEALLDVIEPAVAMLRQPRPDKDKLKTAFIG